MRKALFAVVLAGLMALSSVAAALAMPDASANGLAVACATAAGSHNSHCF